MKLATDVNVATGKVLTDSRSKTDGGSKPHATVEVTLTAPKGYFIFLPSVDASSAGSRKVKSAKLTHTKHKKLAGLVAQTVAAKTVTYTVYSKGSHNPFATSSVTATGAMTAIAYPLGDFKAVVVSHV